MVNINFEAQDISEAKLAYQLEQYGLQVNKEIDAALDGAVDAILATLREITPKRTTITAGSWIALHVGGGEFFITNSNEPIATFLSEGTVEHDVAPISARALHWITEGGADAFSMGHRVRGIEPMHLEERALEANQDLIDNLVAAAEDAAWRQMMQ